MKKIVDCFGLIIGFSALLIIAGCQNGAQNFRSSEDLAPLSLEVESLTSRLNTGRYHQKIDNLILVVDDTASMLSYLDGYPKRNRANVLMTRIMRTIPDIELVKAIRVYGSAVQDTLQNTSLSYGTALPPSTELRPQIMTHTVADTMFNPLAMALEGVYHELKLVSGTSAIILISDFNDPKKEMITSADLIRQYYGSKVCVYPIVIGSDGSGRNSAENVTASLGCGMTALANSLDSGATLADFMTKVLFEKSAQLPPVPAPISKKTETELSYQKLVNERKLTIELKTEFDFDKTSIRPEYLNHLKKIAEFMATYPNTVTTIEGHTCSIGTEKYNLGLSRRRALNVKQHLTALGVEAKRLAIAAFGETRPIADNSTAEGRRKNRRALAVITSTVRTDK